MPRCAATSSAVRKFLRPSIVVLTTLQGLLERRAFVLISLIPADSTTALTAPPAITPVPGAAGFKRTRPAPNSPIISWGIEVPLRETLMRFFFASSIPLRIASGTSPALPIPKPTMPSSLPTTTRAANLKIRPPLTVLDTRLMVTTRSLRSNVDASI